MFSITHDLYNRMFKLSSPFDSNLKLNIIEVVVRSYKWDAKRC